MKKQWALRRVKSNRHLLETLFDLPAHAAATRPIQAHLTAHLVEHVHLADLSLHCKRP
jgi:hypothetical protein